MEFRLPQPERRPMGFSTMNVAAGVGGNPEVKRGEVVANRDDTLAKAVEAAAYAGQMTNAYAAELKDIADGPVKDQMILEFSKVVNQAVINGINRLQGK